MGTDTRPDMTSRPSADRSAQGGADDWVRGGDAAPPAATAVQQTPPPPREPRCRLTLDIPEWLHQKMKVRAATTRVTMLDEVLALLKAHYGDDTQPR